MSRGRSRRAWVGLSLAGALIGPVRGARACEGSGEERIVAYSLDKYAVRSNPNPAQPDRSRFVIRRLSTGEPLDQIDCAATGACELTAVLGMRGCSYARVVVGKTLYGLELDPVGGADSPLWSLSVEAKTGRVP